MDPRLFGAAHLGDVETLTDLFQGNPRICSQITPRKNTALHIAAKGGHSDFVMKILEMKPRISGVLNLEGNTALHEAAKEGKTDVVNILLRHNIKDANKLNKDGESALLIASEQGYVRIAKRLFEVSSANLIALKRFSDGQTCFHAAAHRGRLDVVKEITSYKGNLKFVLNVDINGATPLHSSISAGHVGIVREILNIRPTMCYVVDRAGRSPLHIAAMSGYIDIIHELMCCRPDCIEIRNEEGKTALHFAIENDHVQTVIYLLQNQMPYFTSLLNEIDNRGNTVLHLAVKNNLQQMVELLVSFPIMNINAINKEGFTALDMAINETEIDSKLVILDTLERAGAIKGSKPLISCYGEEEKSIRPMQSHQNLGTVATLVAGLIASLTFQAIVNGPDWIQRNYPNTTLESVHRGDPSINKYVRLFIISDIIAFATSMFVIILWMVWEPLIGVFPRRFVFYSGSIWGISLYFTYMAFIAATNTLIFPEPYKFIQHTWIGTSTGLGLCLFALLFKGVLHKKTKPVLLIILIPLVYVMYMQIL
eukprot:Gb_19486 [translate_table: standard]